MNKFIASCSVAAAVAIMTFLSSCGSAKTADSFPSHERDRAADSPPPAQAPTVTGAKPEMPSAGVKEVSIDNFSFSPQKLTIERGSTVTWTNRDDVPHTVRSTTSAFKSGTLDTDDKFSFTFKEAGTFSYFCTVHSHMTGEITVK